MSTSDRNVKNEQKLRLSERKNKCWVNIKKYPAIIMQQIVEKMLVSKSLLWNLKVKSMK